MVFDHDSFPQESPKCDEKDEKQLTLSIFAISTTYAEGGTCN